MSAESLPTDNGCIYTQTQPYTMNADDTVLIAGNEHNLQNLVNAGFLFFPQQTGLALN